MQNNQEKCLAVGWVRGKLFQVDVPVEILHAVHMTLKYYIGFSESEKIYLSKTPIRYIQDRHPNRKLLSTVYFQKKSLVLTNKNNIVSHQHDTT